MGQSVLRVHELRRADDGYRRGGEYRLLQYGRVGLGQEKSIAVHFVLLALLMMPCILGFNKWSGFTPFGPGSGIMDLEDFIISNNMLPLGSLIILLFCTSRYGWGWKNFLIEADKGEGPKFPRFVRAYLTWVLPFVVLILFIQGYIDKFF